jgi:NADH-quinone oxidoreductase subunit J
MNDTVLYILLGVLVVSSLLTAMVKNVLKAVIALAVVSATLSIVMFLMNAPWAAVFELSVCAGLITAIFVSTISLTENREEEAEDRKKRMTKYIFLPIIVIVVIGILFIMQPVLDFSFAKTLIPEASVQDTIWHTRNLDIAGQIMVILAGVFGVVILFKERKTK